MLWLPIFFTMEFYKGIFREMGHFPITPFVKLSLKRGSLITWSIPMDTKHSIIKNCIVLRFQQRMIMRE